VQQVRQTPIPHDAEQRVLARARALDPPRPPRPWVPRRIWLLCTGAVAALVLLGLGYHYGSYPRGGFRASMAVEDGDLTPYVSDPNPLDRKQNTFASVRRQRILQPADSNRTSIFPAVQQGKAERARVEAMRKLSSGMSAVDRRGLEAYLRHYPGRNVDP